MALKVAAKKQMKREYMWSDSNDDGTPSHSSIGSYSPQSEVSPLPSPSYYEYSMVSNKIFFYSKKLF